MEQAKPIPAEIPVAQPVAPESGLLATWPRCVQLTVALLLALGIGFLLGRSVTADNPRRMSDDAEIADSAGPRLDLNRATRAELALLHGLGPARAQSIEDHRRQHGPFKSVEDLRKVHGIGPKTLDKVRSWLFVDETIASAPPPVADPGPMAGRSASAPTTKGKKEASLTNPVNVNSANAAELQKVPGIGPKTAQHILDERTLRGPFKTVDELRRVPGIGPKTLEKLRPNVVVDPPVVVAGS
jgi:competence protein ComEA